MKPQNAAALLTLMKAKTQVEKTAYGRLQQQRNTMLNEAETFRKTAMKQPGNADDAPSAIFHQQSAKRVTHLLEKAKEQTRQASSLEGDMAVKRQALGKALQRELALEKLVAALKIKARKNADKQEESQHELTRALRSFQKGS